MSLRAFHIVFIALSIVLAAFLAAWTMGEYRSERDASYLIGSIASLLSAGGLAVYGNMFLRKTKGL